MIEKTTSFKTSDGAIHSTVEMAQRHELQTFIKEEKILRSDDAEEISVLAEQLLMYGDKIVDLLTMKATSKPKARKINGGTKTRKPKDTAPLAGPAGVGTTKPVERKATDVPGD